MPVRTYLLIINAFLIPVGAQGGAMAADPNGIYVSESPPIETLQEIQQSLKHAEDSISESNPIRGEITRAIFTHEIDGYEPVDEIISISVKNRKVYFFTDLKDMKGEKIIHRWEYKNSIKATVEFDVNADRYRIHSSKNILPNETGEWTVVVTNGNGQVLSRNKITVVP